MPGIHVLSHVPNRLTGELPVGTGTTLPRIQTQQDVFTPSQPQFGNSDKPTPPLQEQFELLLNPKTRQQGVHGLRKLVHAQDTHHAKVALLLLILDKAHEHQIPPADLKPLSVLLKNLDPISAAPLPAPTPAPTSSDPRDIAFVKAAQDGDIDSVRQALANGVDINVNVDFSPNRTVGWSALHSAASEGHLDIVKLLINAGADVNNTSPSHRTTALHLAIGEHHHTVAEALLKAGANPNANTFYKGTPLMIVASKDKDPDKTIDSIKLLLKYGAKPNIIDLEGHRARTALDEVYILTSGSPNENQQKIIDYLESAGALCAMQIPEHQNIVALMDAISVGDKAEVDRLLDAGTDVNAIIPYHSEYHVAALPLAAKLGRTEIVESMLKAGANPNIFGSTPLLLAVIWGRKKDYPHYREMVKLLLAYGANPNLQSSDKSDSILHLAEGGDVEDQGVQEMIALLKQAGATH